MSNFLAAAVLPLLLLGQLLRFQPFGRVVIYPHDLIIGIVALLVLSHQSERTKLLRYWKKILPYLLPAVAWLSVATLLRIPLLHQSWFQLLYIFRFVVYLSFLGWLWQTFPQLTIVTRSMYWLSGALFAMIALAIYLIFPDMRSLISLGWDEHYFRAVGSLLDPNFTGAVLVLSIFPLITAGSKWFAKNLYLLFGLLLITTATLGLTFSRSAWLGLAVGGGLSLLATLVRRPSSKTKLLPWLIISCLLTVAVVMIAPKPGGEGVQIFRQSSIVARQTHDSATFNANPVDLILGSGLTASENSQVSFHGRLPNNVFLQLFAFGGIPAVILGGYGLIKLLLTLWKKYPQVVIPALVLLALAQFNAVLLEPFVLLLGGTQLILLTQLPPTLKKIKHT